MRSFFLFALLTLALSIQCSPGQFDSAGVCIGCSCPTNKYRTAGCSGTTNSICSTCSTCWSGSTYATGGCSGSTNTQCSACLVCTSGKYRSSGCVGSTNSVCSDCTPCVAGQYQRLPCTSIANRLCENCMTTSECSSNDQYARIYGICGGPIDGPIGTSTTSCMPPGQALCQVCPAQASGDLEIQCNGQQIDGGFWSTFPVEDCCAALVPSLEFFEPAEGLSDMEAFQSRNAWLYDNLLTCTGLRTVYPVP